MDQSALALSPGTSRSLGVKTHRGLDYLDSEYADSLGPSAKRWGGSLRKGAGFSLLLLFVLGIEAFDHDRRKIGSRLRVEYRAFIFLQNKL